MTTLILLLLQAAAPMPPGAWVAAVDSIVARELATGPTAGLSIAVLRGSELLLAKGYGFSDLTHPTAATAETIYKTGSVTKQFTAALVMQLVEEGKVRLDDDIRTHLPEAPTSGRKVTVAQLLDHTSGIRSFTGLGPAVSRDSFRIDLPPDRIVALLRGVEPDFEPGTSFLYNNTGYLLAGMLIEKLTGRSYAEVLGERILKPLGMTSTSYCDERAIIPNRAKGYTRRAGGFGNAVGESMAIPYAAGAICSTVLDLVRFRRALAHGQVVKEESFRRMIEPTVLSTGWRTNYGFGLARFKLGRYHVIRHGGTISGFQANLLHLPEVDVTIAALANTIGSDPAGVSEQVAAALLGIALPRAADRPLPVADHARYQGRYRLGGLEIEIRSDGKGLVAGPPGFPIPARLGWQGGAGFIARPIYAFGFYGTAAPVRFLERGGTITGFEIDHPVDGTVRAERIAGQ